MKNYFVNKINVMNLTVLIVIVVILFAGAMIAFSPDHDIDINGAFAYFGMYYNSHLFFRDFTHHFCFLYGEEWLSSLWSYVPRFMFLHKPYSYGFVKYVIECYYPYAGESGHTPSFKVLLVHI